MAETKPPEPKRGFRFDQELADNFKRRLLRTKTLLSTTSVDDEDPEAQKVPGALRKVLTTFDLISLGVGSCVGTGMYVVAGLVAKNVAGPSVILSFIIAALASILSGVCYGEFGVRVPKTTGSAYMYSYVAVGEFVAFLIGWNLILEYVIGSAAGASAISACFDALGNHTMSRYLEEHVGTIIGKTYPDFLGFAICVGMTAVLALGVKGSVLFNNILNAINFLVWIFIMVAGLFYVDGKNWTSNGFFPYGASGVFSGAATCFYAFIGFDIIGTTGEEAKSASKSIPRAIVWSLIMCLIAYVSVSAVLTLMIPYQEIEGDSALIDMFVTRGFSGAKYIVAIGAIAALTVSLLGSMFPMPRVVYAMSKDGLLMGFLSHVNERFGTPFIATVITGLLASVMTLLVGLKVLVEMMSIGTLLAYTLVTVSVLILRYQPSLHDLPTPAAHQLHPIEESPDGEDVETMADADDVFSDPKKAKRMFKDDAGLLQGNSPTSSKWYGSLPLDPSLIESKIAMIQRHLYMLRLRLGFPSTDAMPNHATAKSAIIFTGFLAAAEFCVCLVLVLAEGPLGNGAPWAVLLLLIFLVAAVACLVIILRQPQNKRKVAFMAPAVPFLPSAAMLFNFYLMLKLPALTWARLGIWLALGMLLYFGYSMWNSVKEKKHNETHQPSTSQAPPPAVESQECAVTDFKTPPSTGASNGSVSTSRGEKPSEVAKPPLGPIRPPLPTQESIEKFRKLSRGSSEDSEVRSTSRSGSSSVPFTEHSTSSGIATNGHSKEENTANRKRPPLTKRVSNPFSPEFDPYVAEQMWPQAPPAQTKRNPFTSDLYEDSPYKRSSILTGECDPFVVADKRKNNPFCQ